MLRLPPVPAVLFFLLALPACLGLSTAHAAEMADRVVAVVNGEVITLYELNEVMRPVAGRSGLQESSPQMQALRKKLLDKMIDDILLKQETEKLKITVTDAEVESQIKQTKERMNLTDEQLDQQLTLERMTRQEYEQRMRDDILRQKIITVMIRRKVVVTDEEVARYHETRKPGVAKDKLVDLAIVLLSPGEDASGLREKIVSGQTSFEAAANSHPGGPAADKGGSLGVMSWKDLAPAWRDALAGLQPGQVSQPVDIQGRQALLKLKAVRGEGQVTGEAAEEIRDSLYKAKMNDLFTEYMERLRSKAVIDVKY